MKNLQEGKEIGSYSANAIIEMHKAQELEAIAIQENKKGWGQLFLKAEDGSPYGEFIGKRPFPTKFWRKVDTWIDGTKWQLEKGNKDLYSKDYLLNFVAWYSGMDKKKIEKQLTKYEEEK